MLIISIDDEVGCPKGAHLLIEFAFLGIFPVFIIITFSVVDVIRVINRQSKNGLLLWVVQKHFIFPCGHVKNYHYYH